jgi:hypothetical protein
VAYRVGPTVSAPGVSAARLDGEGISVPPQEADMNPEVATTIVAGRLGAAMPVAAGGVPDPIAMSAHG